MRIGVAMMLMISMLSAVAQAAPVTINNMRMWPAPDSTRLVFDLSGPVEHALFTLHQPERLVIDLTNARMANQVRDLTLAQGHVRQMRYASRNSHDLRVVLDLKGAVRPKSFILKPHREYGHRLVIDLQEDDSRDKPVVAKEANTRTRSKDVIIAIDAGHGGDDPGALGRRGTREKDVVLKIAKQLEALIKKEPGMKPVMIRSGDYFLSLKKRVDVARKHHADLFISIHADAFNNPRAHGSSVYILSEGKSSSDVAQFLADSENNSDLIGGVSLDDKDELLKMVLVDMVQNTTIEDSHELAGNVLSGLRRVNSLHKNHVEQAGFRVLKAPDVPSILVETAFISNPAEEKKLRSPAHQKKLAQAMLQGIKAYFRKNAPEGTTLAMQERRHRIVRGDTLIDIAERYQVSVGRLRRTNGLRGDVLRVGEILRIPVTGS
ncbi:MAG: N-acetylmuramoyl-L-alanine amidase [Gammaproteobacteria bacterium]|nr:N-acetylmuramoyl-L-alanine amidase [Gammaproteobacteria bacterium]MDH5651021.1 N-acetylmuramoyl-L-alanine amidase [Gammaproteobacteria bacterium]